MQLMVEKSDGSKEVYLHTKVIGSIAFALSEVGCDQYDFADNLAEAVTIYIRRRYESGGISVDEIHAMIQAVLSETPYVEAAVALHEHRISRQVNRNRIEVVKYNKDSDLRIPTIPFHYRQSSTIRSAQPWNKSVIVQDLVTEREASHELARAIAGTVEEKVLRLQCRSLSSSLVQELVNNDWLAMQQAEQALAEQRNSEEEKLVAVLC